MRLYRWTLLLCAVVLLLVGLSAGLRRVSGRPAPFALLFTAPDGTPCELPCLCGVRPGQTAYADAVRMLQAHPLLQGWQQEPSVNRNGMMFSARGVVIGLSRSAYGTLRQITLETEPIQSAAELAALPDTPLHMTSLGDVVSALGTPEYLEFDTMIQRRVIYLYYPGAHLRAVGMRGEEERLSPYAPLTLLTVYGNPLDLGFDLFTWSGFTSIGRYISQLSSR